MPTEETLNNADASAAAEAAVGAETLRDITDQTLADEGPGDVPDLATTDGDGTAAGADDLDSLRAELDAANRRADAEHDAYLRARADFANYKRRRDEETARQREVAAEQLLLGLLPVVDNFERALQSASTTSDYEKLVGGVNATLRQMQDFLAKEGVQPIDALYQPFDPNFHNAVLREETTEYPENTVVEELQKGYTLGERVLRPTMVKVSTGGE
jgi:molecular chaperone GrpE